MLAEAPARTEERTVCGVRKHRGFISSRDFNSHQVSLIKESAAWLRKYLVGQEGNISNRHLPHPSLRAENLSALPRNQKVRFNERRAQSGSNGLD